MITHAQNFLNPAVLNMAHEERCHIGTFKIHKTLKGFDNWKNLKGSSEKQFKSFLKCNEQNQRPLKYVQNIT